MRTTNRPVILSVAALVTIGLLYAQLCSIRCTVYECSPPAPARIAQQSEPSSHCQHGSDQEQSVPASQEHNDSDTCMSHAEVTALLPPGANLSVALYDQAQSFDVEPLFTTGAWLDRLRAKTALAILDRPPPGNTFSILRI